ncbi:M1 family aminopeptidase [Robertkochia solimangrovi]|uniref:M1 family aminopeptidase n=1 Tax=Robertkochia solimangrovi TaxID=2213046 RepID=UPI001180226B|nr:M1 family aminopeptidase [Robertkochia solimangrovi]TRZ42854.1 peptidase M1 [Robertkochia solimangrovi]
MKKILLLVVTLSLVFACNDQKSIDINELIKPGIPLELAQMRKARLSDISYNLHFNIPAEKEKQIPAVLRLEVQMNSLDYPLILDFNEQSDHVLGVRTNTEEIPVRHEQEHLIIDSQYLKKGVNVVEINFITGELSLNRNDDYLYTLLVPDRASTVFPCFDQPNLKATYTLQITTPEDWKVLGGAPEKEALQSGDRITHLFGKTDKMSSYLFSFVAGKFKDTIINPGKFDMRMLYRENNVEKIEESVQPIFDLHQQSIDFLEEYTAYPFPFQKLDFAAIPGFQYGGMEHVGAIQYRESSLFLDNTATENQKLSRAKLIAHETSHMWFGDLVTMKWFNDVWMKEVFANFMADKIVNPAFPDINHDLLFILTHYPRAYGEDRTRGTNPIRQHLENLKDAGSLYGAIIYNKAPIVMNLLESLIGKEVFQEGIQEYIETFADGNADWNELVAILDKRTDHDLKAWSKVWINEPGRPVISEEITFENDKIASLELLQKAEDGSDNSWNQTFSIGLVYPDSVKTVAVDMIGERTEIEAVVGLPKPETIIYNYNGMGYGVFPVDKESIDLIPQIEDDVARTYALINCYENSLNGNLDPHSTYTMLTKAILSEKNELIVNRISGELSDLYWNYLSAAQRAEAQKPLEELAYGQLSADLSPNLKKIFFGLFSSVAYSDQGKSRLYAIWNKEKVFDGLRLNEDSYTGMAMSLALYGHEKAEDILEQAKASLSNPDKIKRFEFLEPALSSEVTVRDAVFESLKEEGNREKESWVLSLLGYLNHPLRQDTSIKYLKPSLEMLEEIQRTGDIFFPKGWLSASVGRYTSEEAYTILQEYLAAHPDLNPVLLKKLNQAADDLYRNHELFGKEKVSAR